MNLATDMNDEHKQGTKDNKSDKDIGLARTSGCFITNVCRKELAMLRKQTNATSAPRLLLRWIVPLLCLAVVSFLSVSPAAAQAFDSMFKTDNTWWDCTDLGSDTPDASDGYYCQSDNSALTYYTDTSLTTTGAARIESRLNEVYDATDLNVTRHTSPVYSGGSETDIIFEYRTDTPYPLAGFAWCDDAVTLTKCDQHYVAFDSATPHSSVVCHEAGHAVGLTHGSEASPSQIQTSASLGCMKNPTGGTTTLPSDITDQIDNTYS